MASTSGPLPPASRRALTNTGVVERIFDNLTDAGDLWSCMGVSRTFRSVVLGAPTLEWRAFLPPSTAININLEDHARTRKGQSKFFPRYQHHSCVNPKVQDPKVLLTSSLNPSQDEQYWAAKKGEHMYDVKKKKATFFVEFHGIRPSPSSTIFFSSDLRLDMRVADPCVKVYITAPYDQMSSRYLNAELKPMATVRQLIAWLNASYKEKLESQTVRDVMVRDGAGQKEYVFERKMDAALRA